MPDRTAEDEQRAIFGDPQRDKVIRLLTMAIWAASAILAVFGFYFLTTGEQPLIGGILLAAALLDHVLLRFAIIPAIRKAPRKKPFDQ